MGGVNFLVFVKPGELIEIIPQRGNIMVLLDQLKKVDDSFCIQSMNGKVNQIAGLCSLDNFVPGGIILIKNNKYIEKLVKKLEDNKALNNIGVVCNLATERGY